MAYSTPQKHLPLDGRRSACPRSPPPSQALGEPAAPLPHGPRFCWPVFIGTRHITAGDEQGERYYSQNVDKETAAAA